MKQSNVSRAAALAAALLYLFSARAAAQVPTSAKSAILMDAQTGRVLAEQDADARRPIASTTKIMTGLLICEAGELEREISVAPEAVGVEGSSMYLKAGERLRVRELLYGLMLHSGNDAAAALAIADAGSIPAFVEKMNAKAAQLGLRGTHYANPHGLDSEENYSTARDLAQLTRAALQNEDFRTVVSAKQASAAGRTLCNHNKLLWMYPGAIGVKTGYTRAAGRILVSAAEREGQRLIAVTISDPDDWADHAALLDYGFSHFPQRRLVTCGEAVGRLPVTGGTKDAVQLIAALPFSWPLAEDEQPELRLCAPRLAFAPCESVRASLEVWLDGVRIGSIPLELAEPVPAIPEKPSFFERIFGGSSWKNACKKYSRATAWRPAGRQRS